jgi:hypothetical protein
VMVVATPCRGARSRRICMGSSIGGVATGERG